LKILTPRAFSQKLVRQVRIDTHSQELIERWKAEAQKPFQGWDFAYLDGRMKVEEPDWSYPDRAAELMRQNSSVLDMGTGGGEVLLRLKKDWPPKVAATEAYPPNQVLARQRLGPLGVRVVDVRDEADLEPFSDQEFELVINRHSAFEPLEVARVLAPGGAFLTQQVHGLASLELLAQFGARPQYLEATPEHYLPQLTAAGLIIRDAREWSGQLSFADVSALVYYLKATPWVVEGFSVETHAPYLLALQSRLERGEPLVFGTRRYLIEAGKPTRAGQFKGDHLN
jgi:SAM-dependent methyltransferase